MSLVLGKLTPDDQRLIEDISTAFWALDKSHRDRWRALMRQLHARLASFPAAHPTKEQPSRGLDTPTKEPQ